MTTAADRAGETLTEQTTPGLDGLPALEREWRALFAASDYEPAMSFEWTQALARTQLNPGDRCYIVQLRRGGLLIGIVPLFVRASNVFGLRHAIVRPLAELKNTHSDLLVERTPESTRALLRALRQLDCRWDSLRMSKLLDGHAITPLLEQEAAALGQAPRRRFRRAAYWLALPGSMASYLDSRSSKFRNYAKRAEKKLRAAGRLDVVEITTPEEFCAGYEALLKVERESWKESRGTSIHAVPREAALYREWGASAAASGQLHLQLLMLDGEPIAHNLGCVHRGTYYYLKTSYAAKYRPMSPATFLRLALVERMIARGVSTIDFCGTPYEWEQQWTGTHRWHHVLSIYANTWRGAVFGAFDRWTHYSTSGQSIEHADARSQQASQE